MENAAVQREHGDLGGTFTFGNVDYPCSAGGDMTGLTMKADGGGFQSSVTKKIVIRSALFASLPRKPQGGDKCSLTFNLEGVAFERTISPMNGVENYNGILTVIQFQDSNESA